MILPAPSQGPFNPTDTGRPVLWDRSSTLHWAPDPPASPALSESLPEEVTCVPRVGVTRGLFEPRDGAGLGYEGPEQPLLGR